MTLVKGCVWIGITPIWKVVDEPAHFDNIQYRAERWQAPRWNRQHLEPVMNPGASAELQSSWQASQHYWRDRYLSGVREVPEEIALRSQATEPSARLSDGQMLEMSYPGFYYNLGVVPYRLFQTSSIVTRAYAIRVLSLLFGLLAVLCAYRAAFYVFDDDPWLAFAVGVVVALQPMASQQTAVINNDAPAIGVGALIFYLQLRLMARRQQAPSWPEYALLGFAAGLGLWCKPHLVTLLPGCAVAVLYSCWPRRHERASWLAAGVALAGFALIALPALPVLQETTHVLDALNAMTRPHAPVVRDSFPVWYWNATSLRDNMFGAYWGRFGWTEFAFDPDWTDWLHLARWAVWAGAGFGLVMRVFSLEPAWWRRRALVLATATAILIHGFVWYIEYRAETQLHVKWVMQGRHILIGLPAVAIIVVWALAAPLPRRLRPLAAAVIVTFAVLMNAGALATIARYHYGN